MQTKEEKKTHNLAYHATVRGRAARLLCSARSRAKRKDLAFDLTKEWLIGLLSEPCPRTYLDFDLSTGGCGKGKANAKALAPSLDRISNERGYTMDNVQVVVWQYNAAKQEYTDAALLELCQRICNTALAKRMLAL